MASVSTTDIPVPQASPTQDGPNAPAPRADIGRLLAPVRGRLILAIALQAIGAAAGVLPFIGIVEVIRALLPTLAGQPADAGSAWLAVWISGAALLVRLLATWTAGMVTHLADADLAHGLRVGLVEHLARVPLGWFSATASGRVRKAVQEDVVALHHLVAHALLDMTSALVVPVVSLAYLLILDWRMALISLIPMVLAVACYAGAMRDAMPRYGQYERSLADLNAATAEFVAGIAVVKTFNQTGRAHRRFRTTADRFGDFFDGWVRDSTRYSSWMELISSPVAVLTIIALPGAALVVAEVVAPIDLMATLVLGLGLTAPLLGLGFSFQTLREAQQAAAAVQALADVPTMPEPKNPARPHGGEVELTGVEFGYQADTPAVRDIDLTLRPGTITALVGVSGSGKSTLAKLVPRFFDVDKGSVRIGGVDVRDIGAADLYRQVGFVFQDPSLLRDSIRENIRLGRPDATDAQVEAVARAAQIHDRITAEPLGYDAVLGTDLQLSGGEQQRVAIARALLADAPILVLDEATAYADPDSEAAIQDALSRLIAGRTVLVVAHRLHTVTGVDQIVVLDAGRIVERGTHDNLLAADGRYAAMWRAYRRAARSAPLHAGPVSDASPPPPPDRGTSAADLPQPVSGGATGAGRPDPNEDDA